MIERESPPIFNAFINQLEEDWALAKIAESHRANKAAETCACPQCIKYAARLCDEMEDEALRLVDIPFIDHEEEWIMEMAWRELERRREEECNDN